VKNGARIYGEAIVQYSNVVFFAYADVIL